MMLRKLPFSLPVLPARLHFQHRTLSGCEIATVSKPDGTRRLSGLLTGTSFRFEAEWRSDAANGWQRFRIEVIGEPDPAWGDFRQLTLLEVDPGEVPLQTRLGWREYPSEPTAERPPEEGGGLLPPNGYPVFGETFFLGIEHPLSCVEHRPGRLRLYHHPLWKEGRLASASLIIGHCREGEPVEAAFARYMEAIRLPAPERAMVEINTFWTDAFAAGRYTTDLESYRAMAHGWAEDVLEGEKGLVSHFLLDAGWQEPKSLYRPQETNGGPDDTALGELGQAIRALGFEFGLWMSLNGPIGIDIDWAEAQGYRVFNRGCGAGYSANNGKVRYICLTDERWENDLASRFEELVDHVPVTFFKGDWDNDALEDPERFPCERFSDEQRREAIADAMIRIYGRIHSCRPDVRLRGAWWLSPWWLPHVDNTHLPNSGDMESSGFPVLAQREGGLTCRDAVYHHLLCRLRTPFPVDALCPHEFASSRRNPVHDTQESWMNHLALWVSRGSHYLQLYLAPYGLAGWKAWSLREILRWFRQNEEVLWKNGTEMLGGDPLSGAVYGYRHEAGERAFLTVRNPLPHPQRVPDWVPAGWTEVYPVYRPAAERNGWLASHEVVVLAAHVPAPPTPRVRTPEGWQRPLARPVPALHRLGTPGARPTRPDAATLAFEITLPYELEEAEVVLRLRMPEPAHIGVMLSRYADGAASFPVPVTQSRAGTLKGYTLTRLKAELPDPEGVILRFPVGTGGTIFAFLKADPVLPEVEGAWVEGKAVLVPCGGASGGPGPGSPLIPPAPSRVREVVGEISLPL